MNEYGLVYSGIQKNIHSWIFIQVIPSDLTQVAVAITARSAWAEPWPFACHVVYVEDIGEQSCDGGVKHGRCSCSSCSCQGPPPSVSRSSWSWQGAHARRDQQREIECSPIFTSYFRWPSLGDLGWASQCILWHLGESWRCDAGVIFPKFPNGRTIQMDHGWRF